MKIEPRKIKKTLKYAAVGACVATSLVTAGCEKERPVLPGGAPPVENVQPTEEVYLDGDIATTPTPELETQLAGVMPAEPMPTISSNGKYGTLPKKTKTPEKEELILSGDIAVTPTPELAGGIPTPAIYDEDDEEETDDEIEFSGEPVSYWEEE